MAGHHARQRHDSGRRHGINGGDHAGVQGLAHVAADGGAEVAPERQLRLDRDPVARGAADQPFEAEAHAGQRVAEDHAENRQRVARVVPRHRFHGRGQRENGDDQPARHDAGGAQPVAPGSGETARLAGHRLAPGEQDHDRGGQRGELLSRLEQRLENQRDQFQLHDDPHGGDRQLLFQFEAERHRQHGVHRHQQPGQGHVAVPERRVVHAAISRSRRPSARIMRRLVSRLA